LLVATISVEQLRSEEMGLIRSLLVDLHLEEQPHFVDHPQLSRQEVEAFLGQLQATFKGENVVFVGRGEDGVVAGFCWVVLFDPGTGLEGEVAEMYVGPSYRGQRLGEALIDRAVQLFRERRVTLGYVWTRGENEAATRLYRRAGFEPARQLVLTWYPAGA
jgi:ribosomal protein S18 acetylase RimI-like enzyme